MKCKRIFLFCLVLAVLSVALAGEKRHAPVPLSELKNPKSPSYVPVPYPKTRQEIITDFEYYLKRRFSPDSRVVTYGDPGSGVIIFPKLLQKDSGYTIGRIFRVKSRTHFRAAEFIVFEVFDPSGNVAVRVALEDCGLFCGANFASAGFKKDPLMSVDESKKFLDSKKIPGLDPSEIKSIEYECLIFGSPENPILNVKTPMENFYMDCKGNVFILQKREKFVSFDRFLEDHSRQALVNSVRSYDACFVDSLVNEALYLKRIK